MGLKKIWGLGIAEVEVGLILSFSLGIKTSLHGLCTFGVAGKHIFREYCNSDPAKFKSIKVRLKNFRPFFLNYQTFV